MFKVNNPFARRWETDQGKFRSKETKRRRVEVFKPADKSKEKERLVYKRDVKTGEDISLTRNGVPIPLHESPLEKKKKKKKKGGRIRKTTKGKGRNFRTKEEGAGMTAKGVKAYRKKNPGSKLKTAVTGKVKKGSKAWKRRKSFCARSKGWKGERGRAARRRWKC